MTVIRPNLDTRGRVVRGLSSLAMLIGAILTWPYSSAAAIVLAGSSAFIGFEAARGWCALRACGVKTRI